MSDRENDMNDAAVDPPESQPGGQEAMNLESPEDLSIAVDPPENQPGGGRAAE